MTNVVDRPQSTARDSIRRFVDVDRHAEATMEHAGTRNVVVMIVADKQRIHAEQRTAVTIGSQFRLPPADARVKQQAYPVRLDIDRVPVGSGLERKSQHVCRRE